MRRYDEDFSDFFETEEDDKVCANCKNLIYSAGSRWCTEYDLKIQRPLTTHCACFEPRETD
jgi:hypothetical protein